MFFRFSENNSGGTWWLSGDVYLALLQTGDWGLEASNVAGSDVLRREMQDLKHYLRHELVGQFDSIHAARASFESIANVNLDEPGCECCGHPFRITETYMDSAFVNDAALRAACEAITSW